MGCAVAVSAQTPSTNSATPPTHPANYVRVDVTATVDGKVIDDLQQDDIELLEDGTRQQITEFSPVDAANGRHPRAFVVFLDTFHTDIERSSTLRTPIVRFLDRLIGPDDLVAVMTPEMAASDIVFGRKSTVISNMMQGDWSWGRRGRLTSTDPKEDLYRSCYAGSKDDTANEMIARRHERQALDTLADLMAVLQRSRDERTAVITVSEGWVLYSPNRTLAALKESVKARNPFGQRRRPDSRPASGHEMAECEADRSSLALLDDSMQMRDITEAANRGMVSFYPMSPHGLEDRAASDERESIASHHESLKALAQDTDGVAVLDVDEVEPALTRISSDLSSYYLLGYQSTNARLDGKFRTITVKIKRPGVQVRTRKGYRGLRPEELMARGDRETPGTAMANAAGAVVVNARAPLRIRSVTWRDTSDEPTAMWLVGELDFATRRELAWSTGATAEVSVVSATGDQVASLEIPVSNGDGAFTAELPASAGLEPGDYAVRVRVLPQSGQTLPLSDLIRVTVPETPASIGEAMMLRRGLSTGARYVVTADPRFQHSDRLRLELPTRLDGKATARLLDRAGTVLPVPVTVGDRRDAAAGFRWVVVDATLAPLAAGDYAIEVTLGTAKQVTPFRVVP
ncbi:MAG TPA: VWA domain-containing protein [Vicinamibacterales bacterium]|nr:VWA domain-containing protein [Vicinamibacterales bacterium]